MGSNQHSPAEGNISEWNEGNFKCLRLHDAQEMINQGKVNAFAITDDGVTWNWMIWKAGIDILYGEGQSKYSSDEIEQVDNIKNLIEIFLQVKPPFQTVMISNFMGRNSKFMSLRENQATLKKYLEIYEKVVKRYNDEHGLSTRNKEEDDWRGL